MKSLTEWARKTGGGVEGVHRWSPTSQYRVKEVCGEQENEVIKAQEKSNTYLDSLFGEFKI